MFFDKKTIVILLAALALSPATALAEKGGNKHGRGNQERPQHVEEHRDRGPGGPDVRVEAWFGDHDRTVARDYYSAEMGRGNCPPGLAKKRNGCLSPGQAKKWAVGRPLPRDVRYYELPRDLVVHMPPPPPGHRYVQVAGDILLIAVGSSMVIDAIQDIVR